MVALLSVSGFQPVEDVLLLSERWLQNFDFWQFNSIDRMRYGCIHFVIRTSGSKTPEHFLRGLELVAVERIRCLHEFLIPHFGKVKRNSVVNRLSSFNWVQIGFKIVIERLQWGLMDVI